MKKDFLKLSDLTKSEALVLLKKAADLKGMRVNGIPHQPLKGKSLGMIFNKNSTRTRISFEVGMFELGGHSLFLTPDQMQLGRGETIADSARVLSRYLHGILIRTFDFKEVVELAKHASIPVINGLTDLNHPVQVLSDLFTIHEKLGRVDGIKIADPTSAFAFANIELARLQTFRNVAEFRNRERLSHIYPPIKLTIN